MIILKYFYLIFRMFEASYQGMVIFLLLSLVVLTILHHFMKEKKEKIWCALCAIPMLVFLVFYFMNRILGNAEMTLQRFASLGVAALLLLLWGVVIFFQRDYKAYTILTYVFTILWLVIGIIFVTVCLSRVYVGNHSHDSWEKSFEQTIDDLGAAYVLRDWKELDYDALKEKYLPLVREAERTHDEVAMLMALYELRYDLYDGHVRVRTTNSVAKQEAAERLAGNDYGFSLFQAENGDYLAVLVEEDCEANRLGIQNGTIITKWDGVPVEEVVKDIKCIDTFYVFSYLENEQIFQPIFLAGHGGDTLQVTLLDENAKEKTVSVSAMGNYLERRTKAIKIFYGTPADNENFHTCMINDHVGYLRITEESYLGDPTMDIIKCSIAGYSKELYDDLNAKLEVLREQGMDRLIIDLRNNDGGYSYLSKSLIGLFTDQVQPSDMGYYLNGSYHTVLSPMAYGTGPWKELPLIVLVNGETGSSGDCMAYLLKAYAHAKLIGNSTTWGCAQCTGGCSILSNGEFSFFYPIASTPGEDNLPIIDARSDRKARIMLDYQVTYDKEGVLELFGDGERDVVLEKALALMDEN